MEGSASRVRSSSVAMRSTSVVWLIEPTSKQASKAQLDEAAEGLLAKGIQLAMPLLSSSQSLLDCRLPAQERHEEPPPLTGLLIRAAADAVSPHPSPRRANPSRAPRPRPRPRLLPEAMTTKLAHRLGAAECAPGPINSRSSSQRSLSLSPYLFRRREPHAAARESYESAIFS